MSKPSLRRKLLLHLLWPLCLTWALGSALVIGLAYYFTTQAYDRSLLDDAYTLDAQVRHDSDANVRLSLTDAEMRAVLFDQSESNYFAIWHGDGHLLAGLGDLKPPVLLRAGENVDISAPMWDDFVYLGRPLRVVSLARTEPKPYVIVVAQTTKSRTNLLTHLLLASLIPQLLLLGALAWWLQRQVGLDLTPLSALQTAVDERNTSDLRPIPVSLTELAPTSDLERLGLAINSLFYRLKEGLQAQREFSGNVAHELRTPLSSIRLQAEHVLTFNSENTIKEHMNKLLASVDHASHLIDQLLALAFADEAQSDITLTTVDLTQVVREAVFRHLPRADTLGVDLGAEGLDELQQPLYILGHRVFLDAVLDNLIDNAFRYGLATQKASITVSLTKTGDHVQLAVMDNGKGLTGQSVAFYKNRWAQASDQQQIGRGVGLGLAIVSRYAELLRARFTLESITPRGGLCAALLFSVES